MSEKKISGYKFNLNSSSDVKKMLSKIASELYNNKIDESKARVLGYLGSQVISCIKSIETEKRLQELEERLSEYERHQ